MRQITGSICALALLATLFVAPMIVVAQEDDEAIYTYVAQWRLERDGREDFWASFEENTQPVLQKMMADGTIIEWATSHDVVHSQDGMTDGMWWCARSIAGTQKVLAALAESPREPTEGVILAHKDMLLKSMVYRSQGGVTSGYLRVSNILVKPGKGQDWMRLWKKYTLPQYEKMMKDGVILGFGVDREHVHTANPRMRSIWVMFKDAESIDKMVAAWDVIYDKSSPEEGMAINRQFNEATDRDAHTDTLETVSRFHHK